MLLVLHLFEVANWLIHFFFEKWKTQECNYTNPTAHNSKIYKADTISK